MKKTILSAIIATTLSFTAFGQAPEGFKYQAVVRDAGNTILNNQAVGVQLTIQQGSVGGTVVYTETFAPTTNAYGLINLEIGTGSTSDDFTTIDWANGPYFIETAVDVTGGTSYSVMGSSQLLSVPYALYAKTAGNSSGGNWTLNGSDISNNNTGKVSIGTLSAIQKINIGDTGTFIMQIGHEGNFNEVESGRLAFTEDIGFNGTCGFEFHHDGAANTLSLESGCTTLGDTSIVFTRTGEVRIPERVKIGENSNPACDVHIKQSSSGTTPSSAGLRLESDLTTDENQIWTDGANLNFGFNGTRISYISNTGTYTQVSDRRLKNNISPMPSVLTDIMKLKPVEYYYNHSNSGVKSKGFIAQDVQAIFPELVTESSDTKMLAVQYVEFGVLAIKSIQEQQEMINKQQEQINSLIEEIKLLKSIVKSESNNNQNAEKQLIITNTVKANAYENDADQ